MKKKLVFAVAAISASIIALSGMGFTDSGEIDAAADAAVSTSKCFMCHPEVRKLWDSGKHKDMVECTQCHAGIARHMSAPREFRPITTTSPGVCGECHTDQLTSFMTEDPHRRARVEKSQNTERSPNPLWDKLMMGHGFTTEHNSPRAHSWMLLDHLLVDRAYGGRFQPKNGWLYLTEPATMNVWDSVRDAYPETNAQRSFRRGTVAAANPNCLMCKTSDVILRWKYMGDSDPAARWSRQSNVVEMARSLTSPSMGCIHCHDPHATKPRIIRDALIDALTRPDSDVLWQADPARTGINVIEFRGFRKIAILDKYDAKLQCAQCHVEYNCNPGYNTDTTARVSMADRRTNHFPLRDVFKIYDHYNNLRFRDFRHTLTGGLLFKAQHPESEVFWNSKHDRAGVNCNDCHMPVMTTSTGETYTSHWQVSPRNYLKQTCLECHTGMSEQQALYAIDSIKHHIRGKMRKAEFWLGALIDKIVAAQKAGVDPATIARAQEQHQKAHILWEWWTAENSDGFHNPDQAKESLNRSIEESREGIRMLSEAPTP